MRTLLICHEHAALDREGLARWLATFSTFVGTVVVREPAGRMRKRIAREIRRVGFWRFLDVLAFRLYYRLSQASSDQRIEGRELEWLRARFPDRPNASEMIVASPNSVEAETFIRRCEPDLIIARCKTLLRIDAGVDTGPVFGYFRVDGDPYESHVLTQHRAVLDHLDAIRDKLREIETGTAAPIDTQGRRSAAWGQPWLTALVRMRAGARRHNAGSLKSETSRS